MKISSIPPTREEAEAAEIRRQTTTLSACIVIFILLLVCLIIAFKTYAAETVVKIDTDLTLSTASADDIGITEFKRNLEGITKALEQTKLRSDVRVFGITDDSFCKPRPLLEGKTPNEEGYFKHYLTGSVQSLVSQWKKVAATLEPNATATDVFGGFLLSGNFFSAFQSSTKKYIVFSDLRHTRSVNLEKMDVIDIKILEQVKRIYGLADLKGVDVYLYGVHGHGKSVVYWNSLRDLMLEYLRQSGAKVKVVSPLREVSYE